MKRLGKVPSWAANANQRWLVRLETHAPSPVLRRHWRQQLETLVHLRATYERPSMMPGFWCWKVAPTAPVYSVSLAVHQGLAVATFWRTWGGPTMEPTYTVRELPARVRLPKGPARLLKWMKAWRRA